MNAAVIPNPLSVTAAEIEELTDPWADVEMPPDVRTLLAVVQKCANRASEAAGGAPRRIRVTNDRLRLHAGMDWIYSQSEGGTDVDGPDGRVGG